MTHILLVHFCHSVRKNHAMKLQMLPILTILLLSCDGKKPAQLIKDLEQLEQRVTSHTTAAADSTATAQQSQAPTTPEFLPESQNPRRDSLVAFAQKYIGTPYKFACATPEEGFDCSGFINFVYNHYGYKVPRSSPEFEFFGTETNIRNAQKGDLVLFKPTETDSTGARIGHIGILINSRGMQSDFIHSSSGKANGVTISSLGSDHYTNRFVKAINVIGR